MPDRHDMKYEDIRDSMQQDENMSKSINVELKRQINTLEADRLKELSIYESEVKELEDNIQRYNLHILSNKQASRMYKNHIEYLRETGFCNSIRPTCNAYI